MGMSRSLDSTESTAQELSSEYFDRGGTGGRHGATAGAGAPTMATSAPTHTHHLMQMAGFILPLVPSPATGLRWR
jgi:hypothetical protein